MMNLQALRDRKPAPVDAPIRRRLATLVAVGPMMSDLQPNGWFNRTLRTGVRVENLTDRPIAEVTVSTERALGGNAWVFYTDAGIPPRSDRVIVRPVGTMNSFLGWHAQVARNPGSFGTRVDAVTFTDGAKRDTVRVFSRWGTYARTLRTRKAAGV
jgi:hypothetical protein